MVSPIGFARKVVEWLERRAIFGVAPTDKSISKAHITNCDEMLGIVSGHDKVDLWPVKRKAYYG